MRGPEVNFFHNTFPASIVGIPGHYVDNVVLENIEIRYPGRPSKGMAYVRHATNIKMKNVKLYLDGEYSSKLIRVLPSENP